MNKTVAVCIPSIPVRKVQLARALSSVINQTHPIDEISVSIDNRRSGAAANRNRAWQNTSSEWIAFLDDDDELDPEHVAVLMAHAEQTGADLVFPWHRILRYGQPIGDALPQRGIKDEDIPEALRLSNFIPINVLVRRSLLEEVGGFPIPGSAEWPPKDCEDWGCWLRILDAGGVISHIDKVTWTWHHWGWGRPGEAGNTSGQADRW